MRAVIDWMEIPATDIKQSAEFYEEVFGWEARWDDRWPEYPMFRDSSGNVGFGLSNQGSPSEQGVLVYITVDSIEEVAPRVEGAGGAMVTSKTHIHDKVGWWASFKDPAGNLIGLFENPAKAS